MCRLCELKRLSREELAFRCSGLEAKVKELEKERTEYAVLYDKKLRECLDKDDRIKELEEDKEDADRLFTSMHDLVQINVTKVRKLEGALGTPIELAKRFHEIYERRAPDFGYGTRLETREFDENSINGKLMIATCAEIIQALKGA